MHVRVPLLKDFEIARPQIFAGLMLLALLINALALAYFGPTFRNSLVFSQPRLVGQEPALAHDTILKTRVEQVASSLAKFVGDRSTLQPARTSEVALKLPFMVFGVWLGAALWWVTRRLYNNAGGYIALALYCSSAFIVNLSSHVNAEIMAAWGLFGIVYTSIGVAHTLYAPPRQWRPRIVLLGTAFGITAAAHLSTALIGLVLAAFFMLYLAPGRRMASLVILAEAGIIAFLILWACYGFNAAVFSASLGSVRFQPVLHSLPDATAVALLPLALLVAACVVTFIAWPRTRYFGNWAPLLVFLLLAHLQFPQADSFAWALPFVFVFVGGIFADLLETRWRQVVAASAILAIAAQEVLTYLR